MSITLRNCSGVSRVAGTAVPTPALFTSTSALPGSATVWATTHSQSSGSETSASIATQRRPWASTRSLVAWRRSARRAQIATSAPASARPSANATPRPEEAPVTMATLPSRRKRSMRLMARSVRKDLRRGVRPASSLRCRAMRKGLSTAYSGLGWLIVALGVLQFFLAGLGIFGAESFSAHETVGGILHGLTVLVFLLAIAGPRTGRDIGMGFAL